MNKLQIRGELNQIKGRQKQQEAARTGDRLKCIEGQEEELVGELQKEFGKGDENILNTIEEADDTESE